MTLFIVVYLIITSEQCSYVRVGSGARLCSIEARCTVRLNVEATHRKDLLQKHWFQDRLHQVWYASFPVTFDFAGGPGVCRGQELPPSAATLQLHLRRHPCRGARPATDGSALAAFCKTVPRMHRQAFMHGFVGERQRYRTCNVRRDLLGRRRKHLSP